MTMAARTEALFRSSGALRDGHRELLVLQALQLRPRANNRTLNVRAAQGVHHMRHGFDQQIDAQQRDDAVRIAMASLPKEQADLVKSYQLGVNSYIVKPISAPFARQSGIDEHAEADAEQAPMGLSVWSMTTGGSTSATARTS